MEDLTISRGEELHVTVAGTNLTIIIAWHGHHLQTLLSDCTLQIDESFPDDGLNI